MVAGDLVNTASRIQSLSRAGHRSRRRAHPAGHRPDDRLRGRGLARAEGQDRAASTLAGAPRRRGRARVAQSPTGLEAPFVGRDRELRVVKELFHACGRRRQAAARLGHGHRRDRQVAARLGVLQVHRRAAPATSTGTEAAASSYGEGVAYWALADMVRMRARIAEDEEPASALEKLRPTPSASCDRRRGAPLRRAATRAPARSSRSARLSSGRTSSPPGASSSSASPTSTRSCWSSRTCNGRTRRCSTSSSTCSSGPGTRRCS